MLKEFKEFAARGNVIDLAVGVIIGASFGKIVTSLVSDVIMPPIGLLIGRVDFKNLFVSLNRQVLPDARGRPEGRGADDQLRTVPQHCVRVPDRRVRDFPAGPADQPARAAPCCGARCSTEDLRVLRVADPARRQAMPALHVGAGVSRRAPGYSALSAVTGFTVVARRAGM